MFKKIWNDSVGSKLISTAIIGVFAFIGVFVKSYYDEKSFTETINLIINYKVKLIIILLIFFGLFLFYWIFKRNFSFLNLGKIKLKTFNSITDKNTGIRYEWSIFFDLNGKPFIDDLEFFCVEHEELPLRLFGTSCQDDNCKNSKIELDFYKTKNYLESLVMNEWRKINNK